jgi:hypothetical protein
MLDLENLVCSMHRILSCREVHHREGERCSHVLACAGKRKQLHPVTKDLGKALNWRWHLLWGWVKHLAVEYSPKHRDAKELLSRSSCPIPTESDWNSFFLTCWVKLFLVTSSASFSDAPHSGHPTIPVMGCWEQVGGCEQQELKPRNHPVLIFRV